MKAPNKLYVVVCNEWDGYTHRYNKQNIGIYSRADTDGMACHSMQGNYKKCDIEYFVEQVEFCEV